MTVCVVVCLHKAISAAYIKCNLEKEKSLAILNTIRKVYEVQVCVYGMLPGQGAGGAELWSLCLLAHSTL